MCKSSCKKNNFVSFSTKYFSPTLKGVDSDLLSKGERFIDILLLDTLDAEVGEGGCHVVIHVDGAHSFLASLLANQVVRMWFVRGIVGDTGDHHHRLARVANHLDGREGLVVRTAVHSRNAAS